MLKRIILFLMLATAACAFAETDGLPSPRNKTYHGYYYFRTEQGDSALMLVINNITVFLPSVLKTKSGAVLLAHRPRRAQGAALCQTYIRHRNRDV